MTKKDFFILIIKIFGLYSIITALFVSIPQSLNLINAGFGDFGLGSVIYFLAILAIVIGMFLFLIFKSHKIVRFLKLDKGFDTEFIELKNMSAKDIIKIATVIIGGFLIINNLSLFLQQTISAFYLEIQERTFDAMNKWSWAVNGANILIGYLLITNLNSIARLLNKKSEEKE